MPGKRISDLTALTGAGSASTDDLVIFDTDASATKRITRAQLAVGMQADTQTLTNKTIDSASNTLTVNFKEAQVETSNGSRTHLFTTVAALLADTGTYTTYAAGQIVEAGGFRYQVAASGASDQHVTTAGGVKLYVLPSQTGRDAKAFGAVGDGTTNDGAELRAAANSFGVFGGTMRVERGTYRVDASSGRAVALDDPISVSGEGGVYTAINPSLAATTDDTLSITPSASYDHTLTRIEGVALHDPTTGNRVGKHGLYLDTLTAGANLPKFTVRDAIVGQGDNAAGWGIYHLNNPANNANGGMYASLFENLTVKGGIRVESSGDSNSICHNVLTGSRLGVWASLASGASLLEIQANNITGAQGAIQIESGSRFRVIGNNIEHSSTGSVANNDSSVVNVTGASGVMYGGVIKENLISAFGSSDATTLLRLRNCRGTLVEDNTFLSGAGTRVGIDIGADCRNVRVGANQFNASVPTQVSDAGVGTMGVVKTASLQNSWVAFGAGQATLKYMKSSDGMIHIWGSVKNGVTTNGTLIFTLPDGFRPSEIIRAPMFTVDNVGTTHMAEVTVETNGAVSFVYAYADRVNVNITFPASDLANAVSLE